MIRFEHKPSYRRFALLLALLVFVSGILCACGKGGEDADSSVPTAEPAEATPEPAETAEPDPTETPDPGKPLELFDYVSEPDETTAERLAQIAAQIPGLAVSHSRQFGDAYYLGAGVELGLNLKAEELDPVFICFIDGCDLLTVGGIRVGMELDELKTVCPDLLVNLNLRSAYYDYSDTAGLELTFDSDYRVKTITYSVTVAGEGF